MAKYLIQCFIGRDLSYSVVVDSLEQLHQEITDALNDGFNVYVEKARTQEITNTKKDI